jgi:hypothetical protein
MSKGKRKKKGKKILVEDFGVCFFVLLCLGNRWKKEQVLGSWLAVAMRRSPGKTSIRDEVYLECTVTNFLYLILLIHFTTV